MTTIQLSSHSSSGRALRACPDARERSNGRHLCKGWSEDARLQRLEALVDETGVSLPNLALPLEDALRLRGQIENFVGVVRVPVGVAGPLRVRGVAADGEVYVPLATTEGALVLSVARGAEVLTAAGGARVRASEPEVTRVPLFVFADAGHAEAAEAWVASRLDAVRAAAETTTRHGRLLRLEPVRLGRRLLLRFVFATADAAGQNMVTVATEAACRWLRARPPFTDAEFFTLESAASLDKKMATLALTGRRGRRVDAEATIPRDIVTDQLHATPEAIARVAREGGYACAAAGIIGSQAQVANVLAALFIATGQDAACVVESGTGVTVFETTTAGDLYASVTIPNLMLGTVGGGTRLDTQRECLALMGCRGAGRAARLAEIAGAAALAGELSLVAALAADAFGQAHACFGRPSADQNAERADES
jgi:hydroxymethylglutaryl-CoA reductase (NADPH)